MVYACRCPSSVCFYTCFGIVFDRQQCLWIVNMNQHKHYSHLRNTNKSPSFISQKRNRYSTFICMYSLFRYSDRGGVHTCLCQFAHVYLFVEWRTELYEQTYVAHAGICFFCWGNCLVNSCKKSMTQIIFFCRNESNVIQVKQCLWSHNFLSWQITFLLRLYKAAYERWISLKSIK